MAATDNLDSLDRLLQATRDQHADEMKAVNDQLFVSQTELRLTQEALAKQTDRTAIAERFSVKLVTQFAMVDAALTLANKAFSDAKELALASAANGKSDTTSVAVGAANGKSDTTSVAVGAGGIVADQSSNNGDDNTPHYTPPPQGYQPPLGGIPPNTGTDPDAPHG